MILVDTSVWVDHLNKSHKAMVELLEQNKVLIHPFVVGEISLGRMSNREEILARLLTLPKSAITNELEVIDFIGNWKIYGSGIGYVDAHLIASAKLSNATLWTRDKRLKEAAGFCLVECFET